MWSYCGEFRFLVLVFEDLFAMQPKFKKSLWQKWLLPGLSTSVFVYLMLATPVGPLLYALSGMAVLPIASDPVKKAWCNTGNWMVDTFQPMVSDERMIQHLQANQSDMEKLAWMVINNQDTKPEGGLRKEFEELRNKSGIRWHGVGAAWPTEPYSVDAARNEKACRAVQDADHTHKTRENCRPTLASVSMDPAFGRQSTSKFCSQNAVSAFKHYTYYPGVPPRIVDGRFQWGVDGEGRPVFHTTLLVPNADHVRQDICQERQITPHWFISVC